MKRSGDLNDGIASAMSTVLKGLEFIAFYRWALPFFLVSLVFLYTVDCRSQAFPNGSFVDFQHRNWTVQEGSPPDIWAIAQAPEGFLWLGTGAGLYQFDGVRFEHFQPPKGEALSGVNIVSLSETRSGDLWIGYFTGGVTLIRKGHVRNFKTGLVAGPIGKIVVIADNDIWVVSSTDSGPGLSHFDGTVWKPFAQSAGLPASPLFDLVVDAEHNMWTVTGNAVFVKPHGWDTFVLTGQALANTGSHLTAVPSGGVWLIQHRLSAHFLKLTWSRGRPIVTVTGNAPFPLAAKVVFDGDGGIWGSRQAGGIFHARPAIGPRRSGKDARHLSADIFTTADGLSTDHVGSFFEDREKTLWVGTNGGLDRFIKANVRAETDMPSNSRFPYVGFVDAQGRVGAYSENSLYLIDENGSARLFSDKMPLSWRFCIDAKRTIWSVAADGSIHALRQGHDRVLDWLPNKTTQLGSCAVDPSGRVWFTVAHGGLLRQTAQFGLGIERPAYPQVDADRLYFPPDGGFWALSGLDQLTRYSRRYVHRLTDQEGPQVGKIQVLFGSGDDFFVAGDLGLARFDGTKFVTLRATRHSYLSRITGIAQSGDYTWLFGITGLAKINTRALRAAFRHPDAQLTPLVLDGRDGLPGSALQDWRTNTLLMGANRRLWIFTNNGVASLDPDNLLSNPFEPPVEIKSLTAGGQIYPQPLQLTLPNGVTNVQIDFAALSLAVPERVRVLYRLDGIDKEWVDPGTRRQAFYTNLAPGSYRFRVIAANNSGLWNRRGQSVTFVVSPTFLQSLPFKILCALGFMAVLWLIYVIRLRQISRSIRIRLEERIDERERIARELHDTLLQGVQGLMLRFQAAANRMPKDNDERRMIDRALDSAESIIVEGRTNLTGLRTTAVAPNLQEHLSDFVRRQSVHSDAKLSIDEQGDVRPLAPLAFHETVRIIEEAAFNALRHGNPSRIDILIDHGVRHLGVVVRDDGQGIDPTILKRGEREGHFGLSGMKERARRLRGDLTIESGRDTGTVVMLNMPAGVAYGRSGLLQKASLGLSAFVRLVFVNRRAAAQRD